MVDNRVDIIGGIWAEGAPDPPATPISDNTYADSALSEADINAGWPYRKIVDGAQFNEMMRRITAILTLCEAWGVIPWSALTTYAAGARVLGSNGNLYYAIQGSTDKDPTTNPTYWVEASSGPSRVLVLTTGTAATYTVPTGVRKFMVTLVGGGGGGGGCDGQGTGTATASNAGGGGGWCRKLVLSPAATYLYTVGAGGARGASGNNDGSPGGNTTFSGTGVNLVATGGEGGAGHLGFPGNQAAGGGGSGGIGTGGDVNGAGLSSGVRTIVGGKIGGPSVSGACPIIGGGVRPVSAGNGAAADKPGEGGGASYENDSTSNYAGGAGFRGQIIIEEYY